MGILTSDRAVAAAQPSWRRVVEAGGWWVRVAGAFADARTSMWNSGRRRRRSTLVLPRGVRASAQATQLTTRTRERRTGGVSGIGEVRPIYADVVNMVHAAPAGSRKRCQRTTAIGPGAGQVSRTACGLRGRAIIREPRGSSRRLTEGCSTSSTAELLSRRT